MNAFGVGLVVAILVLFGWSFVGMVRQSLPIRHRFSFEDVEDTIVYYLEGVAVAIGIAMFALLWFILVPLLIALVVLWLLATKVAVVVQQYKIVKITENE